jgi:DNA-directed RNA polymerase specialized sigma subunit
MKKNFEAIRSALEEHLSAINENTSEIQALFDYLHEMDVKIEKISQRLDKIQINNSHTCIKQSIQPLSQQEKKVFLTLYTQESPLSFSDISKRSHLQTSVVCDCVSSLVRKGIPLQRSHFNNHMFIKIDPNFKELQAKENIINLSLNSFID